MTGGLRASCQCGWCSAGQAGRGDWSQRALCSLPCLALKDSMAFAKRGQKGANIGPFLASFFQTGTYAFRSNVPAPQTLGDLMGPPLHMSLQATALAVAVGIPAADRIAKRSGPSQLTTPRARNQPRNINIGLGHPARTFRDW